MYCSALGNLHAEEHTSESGRYKTFVGSLRSLIGFSVMFLEFGHGKTWYDEFCC
jgi:hypothetical protein